MASQRLVNLIPERFREDLRYITGRRRTQWARIVMEQEVDSYISQLGRVRVLEISGDRLEERAGEFSSYRKVQYPAYDICADPLPEKFDLIIAEQVFEHLKRPEAAARNVYEMLPPGGHFVISTPFLIKIHGYPQDYSRWTPDGLQLFLENAGFHSVHVASWGNRACVLANLSEGLAWSLYNPLRHSLKNEPQFPVVVWAYARK